VDLSILVEDDDDVVVVAIVVPIILIGKYWFASHIGD
jgi:hypothetical protein